MAKLKGNGKTEKSQQLFYHIYVRVYVYIRRHLIFIYFFVYTFQKAGSRLHETDGVKTKDLSSNLVSSLFYNNLLLYYCFLACICIQRTISFASHLWRTSKVSRIRKEKRKEKDLDLCFKKCLSCLNSNTKVVPPPAAAAFQTYPDTVCVSSFSFRFDSVLSTIRRKNNRERGFSLISNRTMLGCTGTVVVGG